MPIIHKLYYSPVKSLSFVKTKSLVIKKEIGIKSDRIYAFTRFLDEKESKNYEKNPKKRNLNYFLTTKNTPYLQNFNFKIKKNIMFIYKKNKILYRGSISNKGKINTFFGQYLKKKTFIKSIQLLNNEVKPFFDTTPLNSISLINLNSIKDFEKKIDYKIEHERFRGNIYIKNNAPWSEFKWINKLISINNCFFKVIKKIPRCSATNFAPNSDVSNINLPRLLIKSYGHSFMGVYLQPIKGGEININDKIVL